jgi:hypothetical protein
LAPDNLQRVIKNALHNDRRVAPALQLQQVHKGEQAITKRMAKKNAGKNRRFLRAKNT